MKRIEILAQSVTTSEYGWVGAGDILNCGDELAAHLVDTGAAKYLEQAAPVAPIEDTAPKSKRKG